MDDSEIKPKPMFSSKKRFHLTKKWIIGVIITILVISGVVCAWLFITRPETSTPKPSAEQTAASAEKAGSTVLEAMKLDNQGKFDDAVATYDNAVKESEDPIEKSILLKNKSLLYINDYKYDEALAVALESESLNQNSDTAQYIALIYEKMGDSPKAIEYYQKAISIVDKTDLLADSDVQYWQGKIDALSGVKS